MITTSALLKMVGLQRFVFALGHLGEVLGILREGSKECGEGKLWAKASQLRNFKNAIPNCKHGAYWLRFAIFEVFKDGPFSYICCNYKNLLANTKDRRKALFWQPVTEVVELRELDSFD